MRGEAGNELSAESLSRLGRDGLKGWALCCHFVGGDQGRQ